MIFTNFGNNKQWRNFYSIIYNYVIIVFSLLFIEQKPRSKYFVLELDARRTLNIFLSQKLQQPDCQNSDFGNHGYKCLFLFY